MRVHNNLLKVYSKLLIINKLITGLIVKNNIMVL